MNPHFNRIAPPKLRSRLTSLLGRALLAGMAIRPIVIGPLPASADVVIGKPGDGGVITV